MGEREWASIDITYFSIMCKPEPAKELTRSHGLSRIALDDILLSRKEDFVWFMRFMII